MYGGGGGGVIQVIDQVTRIRGAKLFDVYMLNFDLYTR